MVQNKLVLLISSILEELCKQDDVLVRLDGKGTRR